MNQKTKQAPKKLVLSDRTKKLLLACTASVVVAGGGWYAYYALTTIAPPDLTTSSPEQVVDYLGNQRGFSRLSLDRREQFLVQASQRFLQDPRSRDQLNQALRRMSPAEQQVFVDAGFELATSRFLDRAREYQRVSPSQRRQFVDNMIRDFEQTRQQLAGFTPQENLAEPFKNSMPTTSDGLTKAIVTRTNARQRAEAQPLFDALTARHKQLETDPGERARFERGGT